MFNMVFVGVVRRLWGSTEQMDAEGLGRELLLTPPMTLGEP